MAIVEELVQDLKEYLINKRVLEVACGNADFSLAAAKYAYKVLGIDISLDRVKKQKIELLPDNIKFQKMNAADLTLEDNSFNVTVCYNALGHLKDLLSQVLNEMARTTTDSGYLMFIATWKMDIELFDEVKKIVKENVHLKLTESIENKKFSALIIKKIS